MLFSRDKGVFILYFFHFRRNCASFIIDCSKIAHGMTLSESREEICDHNAFIPISLYCTKQRAIPAVSQTRTECSSKETRLEHSARLQDSYVYREGLGWYARDNCQYCLSSQFFLMYSKSQNQGFFSGGMRQRRSGTPPPPSGK